MAHTHSASLWQRLTPKIRSINLYESSIIFSRFILIAFNLLLIVLILKPAQLPTPLVEIYLPLSLLVYAVVCLFGPRFLGYGLAHFGLTCLDIILVSLGYYFLDYRLFGGAFVIYFVGIVVNVFYGSFLSSISLALLATLGLTLATYHNLNPTSSTDLYYKIISLNFLTLTLGVLGSKIRNTINLVELEKEETKKQLHRLQALSRIAREIASELEPEKLLLLILQKATELTGSKAGGIILNDNHDQVYRIKAAKGLPKTLIGHEVSPGSGLAGRVLAERKTFREKGPEAFVLTDHQLDLEHFKFAIAAPIWSREEVMGLIFLLRENNCVQFSKDDQLILETLSEHAAIAVVNANLFKLTASLTQKDYLTGVGNLRFFTEQLEHHLAMTRRYQQECSILVVDSDSLRKINNLYGNPQGFRHIKQLAECLKNAIRNSDLIARYDRDIFMIILPHTNILEAEELGKRIQALVADSPLIIDAQAIHSTVCIGVASYQPPEISTAKSLVTAVEHALRQAKQSGQNQLVVYRVNDEEFC